MDELLAQFLVESRELADDATEALLALEANANDRERFDEAFRAFHTLKGGAGIVEFTAMQEALHAAEDLLAAARARATPLAPADIAACLECLDRVAEWLDAIETTQALPVDADATAIVARSKRIAATDAAPTPRESRDDAWQTKLLAQFPAASAQARTAVRYRPDSESFFRHEDPLARLAALPSLLALAVEPHAPWPTLDELDPFSCNLELLALTSAPVAAAVAALGDAVAHCDVVELRAGPVPAAGVSTEHAHELLTAQLRLLDGDGATDSGRIASAGIVAANVLRRVGRGADAERIAAIAGECAASGAPQALRQALAAALAGKPVAAPPAPTPRPAASRAQTLRVAAPRLDALVRLTGELTVAKNAIGHVVRLAESQGSALAATLKSRHETLERLVGELQRSVLTLRVLPLRAAFQRFPRLIREMGTELGKPATLVLEGEDTEADKTVVELLAEPLVHLLRNALDHGIEDPSARAAARKPPVAAIRVRAAREGDHVLIDVADDGGGIDVARVREVARERNVVSADALAAMSDAEAIDLIFAPGFSTARAVTELSGRGVGLDAVRTAVKRLGGQVAVGETSPKGTMVRLTLPFSIMLTQVMTVDAGGQLFGIPLDAVRETLRIRYADIAPVGAAHAIVLRDRTVPLLDLAGLLGTAAGERADDSALVVVTEVNGDVGALRVDRIGERMAVMLKPLDGLLAGLPGIAGSTLLGDGTVLLVLDLAELLQ